MANRVIKFRAWHNQRKEMFDPTPIIDYKVMEINGHVLMQFTGLKDKNGIEIYEGDILINPEKKKGVVVFDDGCFRLQIHKSETSIHYITMNQGYCKNKTVIGNIYENPELLTT